MKKDQDDSAQAGNDSNQTLSLQNALPESDPAYPIISRILRVVPASRWHHADISKLATGADFATARRPYLGTPGATLFAIGMIEAGIVAAITISTSSAYAVGEVLRTNHSLNTDAPHAGAFFAAAAASVGLAAAVTVIPGAPLLAIAISVNVIATLLMLPALVLLLLLANDRAIMGLLGNTLHQNVVAGSVTLVIGALGAVYGGLLIAGQLGIHA